jgi:hypothetical protein
MTEQTVQKRTEARPGGPGQKSFPCIARELGWKKKKDPVEPALCSQNGKWQFAEMDKRSRTLQIPTTSFLWPEGKVMLHPFELLTGEKKKEKKSFQSYDLSNNMAELFAALEYLNYASQQT